MFVDQTDWKLVHIFKYIFLIDVTMQPNIAVFSAIKWHKTVRRT